MRLWRVTHRGHAANAWSGEGARARGGRWNSPGRAVVYASEHAALAVVEVLAYVRPRDLAMFRLTSATFPDDRIEILPDAKLAPGWNSYPHGARTQRVGDEWIERARSAALQVPSSLVPGHNVILNPSHADWGQLVLRPEIEMIPFADRAVGPPPA